MWASWTDSECISKTQGQAWYISVAEGLNELHCLKQLWDKNPQIGYDLIEQTCQLW